MNSEVAWVQVFLESQVQPQIIINSDYLPDYFFVSYDYSLNKFVNNDLTNLVNWLNLNKISLNVKIGMVILKSKRKRFGGDLKIKLNGKRLHST